MMRRLAALVPLVLMASPLHGQETTRLLGRVVDVAGTPVRDIRLRIVGHGEPEIFDSGEFQLQLSGRPAQVQIEVIDGRLAVLYPTDGMIAVPADPTVRVPIVVGKSERDYINDVLAARFVQLESTLNDNGVGYNASLDSLGDGMRRILELLELQESDLRASIEQRRRQADVKPELFETIDAYILEVKDLRDAFGLVASLAAENAGAIVTLQTAVQEYNAAFEALNNSRNAFQSSIRSLWSDSEAEGLTRDLADVYTEAVEEIHKGYVLPLNESLVTLQLAHTRDRPDNAEIRAALAEAEAAVRSLDTRINVLETRYNRLREALERT